MSTFLGSHPTRVDEKGRLKVPSEFKRAIDERFAGHQFFITSKDGTRAEIYPMAEWQKVQEKLRGIPSMNPAKRKFLDVTNYYGQVVEFDTQGRLLLPQLLRERAKLTGDVSVMAGDEFLVVVNRESMEAELETNPLNDSDNAALAAFGL